MRLKLSFFVLFAFMIISSSCKKETSFLALPNQIVAQQLPTIRVDKYFPNGVLQFKTQESFKIFYKQVEKNPEYVNEVLPTFNSFKTTLNNFAIKQSLSTNNSQATTITLGVTPAPKVEKDEYLMDMRQDALPVETLQPIVNNDLDVIIDNKLYQFTRIGQFQVSMDVIENYLNIFEDNLDNIYYNPNFVSMPNETALGNDQYELSPGIIRDVAAMGDDLIGIQKITYLPEPGGGFRDPIGGSTGGSPGTYGVPDYYVNYQKSDFNQDNIAITFNDWAKRRLVFKTRNVSILGIFSIIDMKSKIQREKQFLWMTYWGPSYADELIVGFDNMDLTTNYVFPHPSQVTLPNRPQFGGLADFQIGNFLLKNVLHVNVNLSALNYSLSNNEVTSFIDGQFNSLVGNLYNNLYKQMEDKILNKIDNGFSARWDGYTKSIAKLDEQYKLKVVLGKAEKPQGYSHSNDWTFDWNIGVSFGSGSVPGGYPAQYSYRYEMKSGSFYTRARVGNIWHGIRIVIKK